MIDLSICVPTYRGAHRLARLILGLKGSAANRCELLVYDDGSPPQDAATIQSVVEAAPIPHVLIRCPENRGIVVAMRSLVPRALGRIVLQLDDDVLVPPGLLATVVDLFERLPNVGVLSWRSTGLDAAPGPGQSSRPVYGLLQPATQLASYCMAWRRETYDAVGGLDERFKMYCADSDFALRVTLAGHPSYRVWWPLVPHEEHGAFKAAPELDRHAIASKDLAAFEAKWGCGGAEMEQRALAALTRQQQGEQ